MNNNRQVTDTRTKPETDAKTREKRSRDRKYHSPKSASRGRKYLLPLHNTPLIFGFSSYEELVVDRDLQTNMRCRNKPEKTRRVDGKVASPFFVPHIIQEFFPHSTDMAFESPPTPAEPRSTTHSTIHQEARSILIGMCA